MAQRIQKTPPYNSASSSADKKEKTGPNVKVYADMSKERLSPGHDPLHGSLSSGIPDLPVRYHYGDTNIHVHAKGASYNPSGEFGKVKPVGKGRGVYSYGGAPNKKGDNPLGSPTNRKGDNPLGRAMNKVGVNAIGKNLNRKGSNAVGENRNRAGEKSGYGGFSPRGGGKNV